MKQDGGPAFPHEGSVVSADEGKLSIRFPAAGMSLRDYFAGQAVLGQVQKYEGSHISDPTIAHRAYQIADAMIAEREKK